MPSDSARDGIRAHYATKSQLTKAYLGLTEARHGPEDRSVSAVLPGLFLSGKDVEADLPLLHSLGISHVLQARNPESALARASSLTHSVTDFPSLIKTQAGIELTPSHPSLFTYLKLPMYDLEEHDLLMHLPESLSFIDGAHAKGGAPLRAPCSS